MAANLWPYQAQFAWSSTLDGTLTDQSRLWLNKLQQQVVTGGLGVQLGGDIGGTNASPKVVGLQGNKVSAAAPADTQVLTWVAADNEWESKSVPATPLPPATATQLGGVKIGANVTAQADGTISVAAPYVLPVATAAALGGVKEGANVTIAADGTISVAASTGGTVTSVALSMPAEFGVTGSPVTTTGTLTVAKASQAANLLYASPSGVAGVPAFRALVQADLPAGIAPQVNADWNASTGVAQILNKPTIPAAQVNSDWNASSGVAMILNKPVIPAAYVLPPATTSVLGGVKIGANVSVQADGAISVAAPYALPVATTAVLGGVKQGSNVTIAGDGTISVPPAQVNSDWNASTGVAMILNKPTIPPAVTFAGDLSGTSSTQTVIGLRGRSVTATAPGDGQVLTWVNANSDWEPKALPAAPWQTWIPTLSPPGGMTATSTTITYAEWVQVGKIVSFLFDVTTTLGGTMQILLNFSAPVAAVDSSNYRPCWGYIVPPSGTPVAAWSDIQGSIIRAGVSGAGTLTAGVNTFRIGGHYRVA